MELRSIEQKPHCASARQRRTRAGRSASLRRSAEYADSLPVLGLVARRRTHFASLRSNSGDESVYEARKRAATSPVLLSVSEAHCVLPGCAIADTWVVFAPSFATNTATDICSSESELVLGGREAEHPSNASRRCDLHHFMDAACPSLVHPRPGGIASFPHAATPGVRGRLDSLFQLDQQGESHENLRQSPGSHQRCTARWMSDDDPPPPQPSRHS
jgi:hypothetical protein